jgi:release factor glutamine methyltransferase
MKPQPLIRQITDRLAEAGIHSARADAVWLVRHAYGLRQAELYTAAELPPEIVHPLVERRVAREPLQHILGVAPFRHIQVAVGPGVFVPRPETELLVDAVLPILKSSVAPTAADLCAGSGALALALADEVPGIVVQAVECAPDALRWLRRNCAGTPVVPVAGDITDPALPTRLPAGLDAVVSNPPYVPTGTPVPPEVRADPREAVFAGPDGLTLMRPLLACAAALLHPGGILALEHDEAHATALHELIVGAGPWTAVTGHRDLAGRARFVTAERRAG